MLHSKRFIKFASATAAALAVALTFFACGDKTTDPGDKVATEDVKVQVTVTTIPILYTAPIVFDSGVSNFGTTTATTVTFTANDTSAATPVFKVKTATDSASGVTTFGSCIFTIKSSTFLPPAMVVGSVIEISPCEVNVETSGKPVATDLTQVSAKVKFGTATAGLASQFSITISDSGSVIVNSPSGPIVVGEVDLGTLTGGN